MAYNTLHVYTSHSNKHGTHSSRGAQPAGSGRQGVPTVMSWKLKAASKWRTCSWLQPCISHSHFHTHQHRNHSWFTKRSLHSYFSTCMCVITVQSPSPWEMTVAQNMNLRVLDKMSQNASRWCSTGSFIFLNQCSSNAATMHGSLKHRADSSFLLSLPTSHVSCVCAHSCYFAVIQACAQYAQFKEMKQNFAPRDYM